MGLQINYLLENLPTTSTVVGSSDCNGDQMDDVAVMSVINREIVLGVDPEGNTIYQFYDLHRFKVYKWRLVFYSLIITKYMNCH
ncbi:MAG: hypothetical protein IPN46_06125 [Saprospiraceae bacterium]|nr:hypothetical protein [Saprospiraceae bacterium]